MRTLLDRLRHTLLFELVAIAIATPIAYWITEQPMVTVGTLTIVLSLLAMSWNFVYNWAFDLWEQRMNRPRPRSLMTRIGHALGFELVLLVVGIFVVAWWLQMSLWQALLMDLGFMLFFLFYALVFNWAYDILFPIPVKAS